MKAKFFSASGAGPLWKRTDVRHNLEIQVNAWLSDNPNIRIIAVQQSAAGGSLNPPSYLVSVWYEDAEQPNTPDPKLGA